jgi:hypothetical protein
LVDEGRIRRNAFKHSVRLASTGQRAWTGIVQGKTLMKVLSESNVRRKKDDRKSDERLDSKKKAIMKDSDG